MPELPEIALYLHALEQRILGEKLEKVRLASISLLKTFDPPVSVIEGKTVRGLRRLGKRVVIDFDDDIHAVIHLMIAGRFQWKARGAPMPKAYIAKLLWENDIAVRPYGRRPLEWAIPCGFWGQHRGVSFDVVVGAGFHAGRAGGTDEGAVLTRPVRWRAGSFQPPGVHAKARKNGKNAKRPTCNPASRLSQVLVLFLIQKKECFCARMAIWK